MIYPTLSDQQSAHGISTPCSVNQETIHNHLYSFLNTRKNLSMSEMTFVQHDIIRTHKYNNYSRPIYKMMTVYIHLAMLNWLAVLLIFYQALYSFLFLWHHYRILMKSLYPTVVLLHIFWTVHFSQHNIHRHTMLESKNFPSLYAILHTLFHSLIYDVFSISKKSINLLLYLQGAMLFLI